MMELMGVDGIEMEVVGGVDGKSSGRLGGRVGGRKESGSGEGGNIWAAGEGC
jgi:hypothetical protein